MLNKQQIGLFMREPSLVGLVLALLLGTGADIAIAQDYLAPANEAFVEGDYVKARQFFQRALLETPDSTTARTGIAKTHYMERRIEQAWQGATQALEQDPDHLETLLLLGQISMERREREAALEYYQRASKHHQNSARAHFGLGSALNALGKQAEAKQAFDAHQRLSGTGQ